MTKLWEHDWLHLGGHIFWCNKCGVLKSQTDLTMYRPLGGDWIISPPDCVVAEDGPDENAESARLRTQVDDQIVRLDDIRERGMGAIPRDLDTELQAVADALRALSEGS